eukprot:2241490-Prorocentrum_lima.AAC.1
MVYLDVGGDEVKLQYPCRDPAFQARTGQPVLLHRCQKAEAENNAGLLLVFQSHKLAGIYEQPDPTEQHNEVILDLACGIGGFTAAARALGYPVAAAVDTNTSILQTYVTLWGEQG